MRRKATVKAVTFFITLAFLQVLGECDEILVCGFFSDSVGRYDSLEGQFLGNYETGIGLDGALAARIGPDGLLYVASEGSNQIKRYDPATGDFVDNFVNAGNGLNGPSGITWDSSGNLVVASFNSDSILRYNGSTGVFIDTPVASGGGGLNGPDNGTILGPDGFLYVPSYFSNQIIRYDLQAQTSEVFINGIGRPRVLVFEGDFLFVTSETADAVRRYTLDGTFVDNFIQPGSIIMDEPVGLLFVSDSWFVTSATLDKVLRFNSSGTLADADYVPTGSGGLNGPVFLTSFSILLGDLNGDGVVNLLDVAPFVNLITNGIFQEQGDINQDGAVDLLDVAPFVALLTG